MSLIEIIKQDQLNARKEKLVIKSSILTTLIGEAEMVGKNDGNRQSTDEEVVKVIKKFIKNIDDTLNVVSEGSVTSLIAERVILESYLPKQLTAEDIVRILSENYPSNPPTKAVGMKFLKENYAGRYDGKLASQVIDSL